ncbi:Matrix metalloproteinase-17 [Holothuria leucospilota]|uniref:Matrix metalloproteinase-17 n=1 Tax=Holothuria leucospilota TaxID=206669 RepID=A0A9Q1BD82_HOLLE|nr:Matrix metalloproteinase-17 [Holothuria leucospilota]
MKLSTPRNSVRPARGNKMCENVIIILFFVTISYEIVHSQEYMDDDHGKSVDNEAKALNYLFEYGWLVNTDGPAEINSQEVLRDAIAAFQRFAGLEVTGELDDATKELMSTPRCGYPDFFTEDNSRKKRLSPTAQPWPRKRLSWFLENYPNDNLNSRDVENQISRAFQRWADASGLIFFKSTDANSADIRLSFQVRNHGDGAVFDGPGGSIAHAFPPGSDTGGDVHFDDDERFRIYQPGRYNLHQITTHELGHSLGLGHSRVSTAVMAPFYRDIDANAFQLQPSDISSIQTLYRPIVDSDVPPVPQTVQPRQPIPRASAATPAPTTTPTPPRTVQSIQCNAQFDAATETVDGGVYFFQGEQVFKVKPAVGIVSGYPKRLSEEFKGLNIGFIDAALTYRVHSNIIVIYIFKGDYYWLFDQRGIMKPGYPRSITLNWRGLPGNLDAAFIWSGNGFVYFIKGNHYYRYNPRTGRVEPGYPRSLHIWKGVEAPVDGVVRYENQTFFFRGQFYKQFDDRKFSANYKVPSAPKWLGCVTEGLEDDSTMATTDVTAGITNSCNLVKSHYVLTWIFYVLYLLMKR